MGLGAAVVLRLVSTLPQNSYVFFDRYFSTIALLEKLSDLGIEGTGTIMANRVTGVKFKADNELQRGESESLVHIEKPICLTKWKDNKSVLMASTAFGIEPVSFVKRWDKI